MTQRRSLPWWRHDLYHAALLCAARRRTPERSKAYLAMCIRQPESMAVLAMDSGWLIHNRVALRSSTKTTASKAGDLLTPPDRHCFGARGKRRCRQCGRRQPRKVQRVFCLRIEPNARFAHLLVSILAAISVVSQAKPACLTTLIVSRPDRRLPRAPTQRLSSGVRVRLRNGRTND